MKIKRMARIAMKRLNLFSHWGRYFSGLLILSTGTGIDQRELEIKGQINLTDSHVQQKNQKHLLLVLISYTFKTTHRNSFLPSESLLPRLPFFGSSVRCARRTTNALDSVFVFDLPVVKCFWLG